MNVIEYATCDRHLPSIDALVKVLPLNTVARVKPEFEQTGAMSSTDWKTKLAWLLDNAAYWIYLQPGGGSPVVRSTQRCRLRVSFDDS